MLDHIREHRGFDFSGYKRPGLERRVQKRLSLLELGSYSQYQDYLEVHPEEFGLLFTTVLINVTSFFRDRGAWTVIEQRVLPEIVAGKGPHQPIRVWSAGCASGEEAYSIVMAFAELLGRDQTLLRLKVYATDIDDDALAEARSGRFAPTAVQGLEPELLERYFEPVANGGFHFDAGLRRTVIFGRHDLTADAPISHVDLLVCRNTVMYLNAETQAEAAARFHYALNPGGFMFLGRAETLVSHRSSFEPYNQRHRIYRRADKPAGRTRLVQLSLGAPNADEAKQDDRVLGLAANLAPLAQVVLDADNRLVAVNVQARQQFAIGPDRVGSRLADLPLTAPDIDLEEMVAGSLVTALPAISAPTEWPQRSGSPRWYVVAVTPLADGLSATVGTTITFQDVTETEHLRGQLHRITEDLATANEELIASNEELASSNEELQSTNEELETTNEELHSTNEELETMNDELQHQARSSDHIVTLLDSVVASLGIGVAIVDPRLDVELWNGAAADLWGVRSDEVLGTSFTALDIGLPVAEIVPALRACLAGESAVVELRVRAINRRGVEITCDVRCFPLVTNDRRTRGAVIQMMEVR